MKNLRQIDCRPHPCSVRHFEPASQTGRPARRCPVKANKFLSSHLAALFLLFLFALAALSQTGDGGKSEVTNSRVGQSSQAQIAGDHVLAEPPGLRYQGVPPAIPQDQGLTGLHLELLRLGTTARLMQVVAHPDDEDGGMLTLESRGYGVDTLLMTLNRGEGGQNKIGSNLSDVLGVLRTEELLASDEYYGVQERFSRVADFGFSKTAEETFQKWGGHDVALGDMVRVIRTFRPDVLVARFSGTDRDGHGNHQASAILAREAFRAAGDPKRFPEQIAQGLQPWQPKKFYRGNVCPWGAMTCPDGQWTVKFNTGERNDALGMSYIQFAMQGLRHQMSQGAANWSVEPGDRFTFYKLDDSVIPSAAGKDAHEKSFFDGIDQTLPGLAARLGAEEKKLPQLKQQLNEIAGQIAGATSNSDPTPGLMQVVSGLRKVESEILNSSVSAPAKGDLLTRFASKQQQAETALNLALGVAVAANVFAHDGHNTHLPKEADALTTVSPGQEFVVAVTFHNGSKVPLLIDHVGLEVPTGWTTINGKTKAETVKPDGDLHADFRLRVPKGTAYTRPYWHRDDPNTEAINHIDNEKYATLPFPPPALRARVDYSAIAAGGLHTRNGVTAAVVTPFLDESGKERSRTLAIVPAFSVMLEPATQVISTQNGSSSTVSVGVTSNIDKKIHGELRLELPKGWRSDPEHFTVDTTGRGEKKGLRFKIFAAGLQQGRTTLHAVLEAEGQKYAEGYTLVTREDLGSFYYFQPARQRVSIVDVKVPHELKVGYIMGAGDEIPDRAAADRHERDDDSCREAGERRSQPVRDHCPGHSRL